MENKTLRKACEIINTDYTTILEFGVAVGTSTRQLRSFFPDKYKIIGFDSFEGLPEDWMEDKSFSGPKGSFSTNGAIPNIAGVEFIKGWYDTTIPLWVKNHKDTIGLIHMDCDIYSSAITVLESLNDLIGKETVISFDDWMHPNRQDPRNIHNNIQRAFHEWAMKYDRAYELLPVVENEHYRRIVIIKIGDDKQKKCDKCGTLATYFSAMGDKLCTDCYSNYILTPKPVVIQPSPTL